MFRKFFQKKRNVVKVPPLEQIKSMINAIYDSKTQKKISELTQVLKVESENDGLRVILQASQDLQLKKRADIEALIEGSLKNNIKDLNVKFIWRLVSPVASKSSSLAKVKNIIGIASGKGGVGKSTVSVLFSHFLATKGLKVGLLDLDVYGPSASLMTKAGDPNALNGNLLIPPVASGIKDISPAMFSTASQAQILRGPMAGNVIKQFLTQVDWGELDYLVLDYPPGTGDIQITVSQTISVDGVILVTTPQNIATSDVVKSINMFDKLNTPILGLIENMSFFTCNSCSKKHEIFGTGGGQKLAQQYGFANFGQLPLFAEVLDLLDNGKIDHVFSTNTDLEKIFSSLYKAFKHQLSERKRMESKELGAFTLKWRN